MCKSNPSMDHASSIGGTESEETRVCSKFWHREHFLLQGKLLSMQWPPKCIRHRDLSRFNKLSDFFKVFPWTWIRCLNEEKYTMVRKPLSFSCVLNLFTLASVFLYLNRGTFMDHLTPIPAQANLSCFFLLKPVEKKSRFSIPTTDLISWRKRTVSSCRKVWLLEPRLMHARS